MTQERGPWIDVRMRWRAAMLAVAWAALLGVVALVRPLSASWASPGLRLSVTLAIGLGVAGTALLASLKGHGQAAPLAFYAFLVLAVDALGQVLAPLGWPVWPLMALLVAAVAVAEGQLHALGVAALATLLAAADAAAVGFTTWKAALAGGFGYVALALAVHHALLGEKRHLVSLRAELARLASGLEQLDTGERGAPVTAARAALRQASEEGRRRRQLDRASELDAALGRLTRVARAAIDAHGVLYFDLDHERASAVLRAADTAEPVRTETASPALRRPVRVRAGPPAVLLRDRLQAAALVAAVLPRRGARRVAAGGAGADGRSGGGPADRGQAGDAVAHRARARPAGRVRRDGGRGHPADARVAVARGAGSRVQGRLRRLEPPHGHAGARPDPRPAAAQRARPGPAPGVRHRGSGGQPAHALPDRRGVRLGQGVRGPRGRGGGAHLDQLGPAQCRRAVPARRRGGRPRAHAGAGARRGLGAGGVAIGPAAQGAAAGPGRPGPDRAAATPTVPWSASMRSTSSGASERSTA